MRLSGYASHAKNKLVNLLDNSSFFKNFTEIIKISDTSHFDMAVSLLEEGFTETRKSWKRLFSAYIPPQGNL